MTVTLQANALVTEAEATLYLKLGTSAAEVDLVRDLINRASDICEGPDGAERPLKRREFENLRLPIPRPTSENPGGRRLRPPATPIDIEEPVVITLDDIPQTVWLSEADGSQADKDVVVVGDEPGVPTHFERGAGWRSDLYGVSRPILLTYTGGYDPLPGNLRDAVLAVIDSLYRFQERKGGGDVQAFGAGPVTPSVTYRNDLIPPMRAKLILDKYRVPAI